MLPIVTIGARGVDRVERQRAGARGVARRIRQRRRDRNRLRASERIALGRIGVEPARRALGEVRRQQRTAQLRPVHRHRHRRAGAHREAGIEAAVRRIRQVRHRRRSRRRGVDLDPGIQVTSPVTSALPAASVIDPL